MPELESGPTVRSVSGKLGMYSRNVPPGLASGSANTGSLSLVNHSRPSGSSLDGYVGITSIWGS